MSDTNGHAERILHATTPRLHPQQSALLQAHDDLRACEAELVKTRQALGRANAKLAKHDAARSAEALALRVLQVEQNVWHVPSDTAPGGRRVVVYGVYTQTYTCDCGRYVHRGDCRHVAAVSIANRPAAMVAADTQNNGDKHEH